MTEQEALQSDARYATLQARAHEVNHHLRLTVIAGPETVGEVVTVLPITKGDVSLEAAMDAIEAYLDSPAAPRRGELYRKAAEARDAYGAALAATTAARKAMGEAEDAIQADTYEALDAALNEPEDGSVDDLESRVDEAAEMAARHVVRGPESTPS